MGHPQGLLLSLPRAEYLTWRWPAAWILRALEAPGAQRGQKPWAQGYSSIRSFLASSSRHTGQPWVVLLYCWAPLWWPTGRGYSGGSTLAVQLVNSANAASSFPQKAFPVVISFLPFPQTISPQSTAVLTPGLLSNPHSSSSPRVHWWTCVQSGVHGPITRTLQVVLTLCRLPQISCFTLLWFFKCFPSVPTDFPGIQESSPLL